MGIYMSSHAMIGVKFTPTHKTKEVTIRGCDHSESKSNFCAICGKKMWINGTIFIHQFEDIHEDILDSVAVKLNGRFDGFVVTAWDYNSENFYLGYGATVENHEDVRIPLIDFEHIKNDLKEILEEFGIWEQCKDSFGLWVVSTGN